MAAFPAFIPSERTFTPGTFPHTPHQAMDGSEVRVRHSNVMVDARLQLVFPLLTTAEVLSVRDHYVGQLGGLLSFALSSEIVTGITAAADYTPTGHGWIYLSQPSVEDVPIDGSSATNVHNLTVELGSVPPESQMPLAVRFTVRATWAPGVPIEPWVITVATAFVGGVPA